MNMKILLVIFLRTSLFRQFVVSEPGLLYGQGAILPFPTKLLEFCWQKADRFCASASFKLQPGSEHLNTRQRMVGWQRARLMLWFHYYELNQAESLFRGCTWISLSTPPNSRPVAHCAVAWKSAFSVLPSFLSYVAPRRCLRPNASPTS